MSELSWKLIEHDEHDGRRRGDPDVRSEAVVREDRRRAEERDETQHRQDQGEREEQADRTPACICDDRRDRQHERSEHNEQGARVDEPDELKRERNAEHAEKRKEEQVTDPA